MRTKFSIIFLTCLLSVFSIAAKAKGRNEFAKIRESAPFEMGRLERPSIPDRSVNIEDFGGNGNGTVLNTDAFARAMKALSAAGGGHLIVPAGIWKTGPIRIESNIDLHVERDAIIIFDPDRSLYPVISTVFEGLDTKRCESPISAQGAHDISITGGGVIDGSGDSWRAVKKSKVTEGEWKKFLARGGVLNERGDTWYPDEGFIIGQNGANMNVPAPDADLEKIKSFLRPVMVSLRDCENVLIEDCLFQNSPAWNLHPFLCRNLIINRVTVRNPAYSQNGDGLDIDSCTDVLVKDSTFDCGDDGICLKSGKDEDGRRRAAPCSRIIIDGCTVYRGHGGFVVGSEMSGGVKDVLVTNCRFLGTDVGLRFKSKRGRGGVVEGIWIDNIHMKDIVTDAILFDLFYGGKSAVEAAEDGTLVKVAEPAMPVDETTPEFRDIHISRIVCNGAARAMLFNGLPEKPVSGIDISDCKITADKGIEIYCSERVSISGALIMTADGPQMPFSEKMVRSQKARYPEATYLDFKEGRFSWNYTPGLELRAFLDVYAAYGGEDIWKYVSDWFDAHIDAEGNPEGYSMDKYSTDLICPAKTLFAIYDRTSDPRYRKTLDLMKRQIDGQPRTEAGAFWHKAIYPDQVWLDGVYMAEPFYAEYVSRFFPEERKEEAFRDIVNEFKVAYEKTFDRKTGLLRHAWDESGSMFWADPATGQSEHCWGRALGWYVMAVNDVLDFIPAGMEAERKTLIGYLRHIYEVLPKYADPVSGVWYQVLDQPGREGNYLEATCSSMFCYAALKGVRMGYLDRSLLPWAKKLYQDVCREFITYDGSGLLNLEKCCSVGGLGGSGNRKGDYAYYLSEPVRANDSKGTGPFIWASLEVEKLP